MSHKPFPRFRSGAAIATAETAVAQQGIPSVRPFVTASPALSPPSGKESGEKEFLLRFFDLKRDPFSNVPEDQFFYTNAAIRQVYRELINALCERSGGAVLTGEAGVGKTTLLCRIRGELKAAGHLVIARYRAGLCFNELVTVIAEELQVPSGNDDEVGFPTRLREQLERNKCARPPILIIDDAERLGGDVIRNLGRLLVGPADRSLRVLLSGRPELARRLELPVLAELRRMLLVSSRLERLDDDDAASYIFHRLRVAGYRGSDLFLSAAINTVVAKSGGLPRQIDRLCTKSLTLAAATGKPVVTSEIVEQAAGELRPKDASPVKAAFAEAPAITIARRGWANAVSNMLIGRVRGARLPARAMTERPAHLAQRHENTTSALDLDAWEVPRRPTSHARRPGGIIKRPELSLGAGAPWSETAPGRRAIAQAVQRPRSAFAVLLGVIAVSMMGSGAVWLALSGSAGDRFEGALGGLRVAQELPSLAAPPPAPPVAANAPMSHAATPSVSTGLPPAPATPMGAPPNVGPLPPKKIPANELSAATTTLSEAPAVSGAQTAAEPAPPAATVAPVASPAPGVEHTPETDSPPVAAATPTIPSVEAPAVSVPSAEPPPEPTAQTRLANREPLQAQRAPQHETLHASPDAPELAQPTPTGSSVSPAENTDSPTPPPLVATLPLFGPPALSGPPLATPSPLASPPASSPPTMDKRPGAPPARLHAQPAPETSAASARRPMQTSEPRSKSAPTKQARLEAPKPKRYDGPPIDADQLPPLEGPVIPPAPALASTTPNMHPPTSLLPRPAIASGSPVVSCRAYTSTHNQLGQLGNARGVACREPGGQWTIVQETFN